MTEPTIRRNFILSDLDSNNNKYWNVEYFSDGTLKTKWGRVGTAGDTLTKQNISDKELATLIKSKLRKGYVELELHKPSVSVVSINNTPKYDKQTINFLEFVFKEAGEKVQSFLATSVDALSVTQIQKGRDILDKIIPLLNSPTVHTKPKLMELVGNYYNTIPTKIPARPDISELTRNFVGNLNEQEDRLDQLEAALNAYNTTTVANPFGNLYGLEIKTLDKNAPLYDRIVQYVGKTITKPKIHFIFTVMIPTERATYEAEVKGKHNIATLWHGTKSCNIRHIMKSGLVIPKSYTNGWRMGAGIYMADTAKRSYNYASSKSNNHKVLFLLDVALGTPAKLPKDNPSLREAPKGYDSVWGIESYSKLDEFVVYKNSQQTIKAIVVME